MRARDPACSVASSCLARHGEAIDEGPPRQKQRPAALPAYDMLGEGACTDATPPLPRAYVGAIAASTQGSRRRARWPVDQAQRCSPVTKVLRRERVFAELLPRVWALIEKAGQGRHQPDHRRRRSRPPGAVAGRAGRPGGQASRTHFPQWTRLWPGHPGLPDPCAEHDEVAIIGPRMAQLHGAPGQGRLLGRRDQARPGNGAWPPTRCSRTSTTPTSATWPAPRR